MFDDFESLNLFPTTAGEIITNITVALICGLFISWLYRKTYRGPGYSTGFLNSIVLLTMITTLVIMVIGNNLARAFGLVGAMSIIRFRTAIKDTQDIVFIFFSLAIGMAAGAGYHKLALISTLFIGAILYVLSKSSLAMAHQKDFLLQFSYFGNGDESPSYLPVMQKYCRRHKPINARAVNEQDLLELSYYVKFKDEDKNQEFMRELKKSQGVRQINLFYDEEAI